MAFFFFFLPVGVPGLGPLGVFCRLAEGDFPEGDFGRLPLPNRSGRVAHVQVERDGHVLLPDARPLLRTA